MSLVDRARSITLKPQLEWPLIAAEPATASSIVGGYLAPLAAIGPLATAIGLAIFGIGIPFIGTYREPIGSAVIRAVVTYVLVLVGVAVMTAIANALAPTFGGRKHQLAALKLVAYAYTPALIAGIFSLIPGLAFLGVLAGLWSLYVFYLGAPALFLCAREKAFPYTAACIACGFVLGIVVGVVINAAGFIRYGYGVSPGAMH